MQATMVATTKAEELAILDKMIKLVDQTEAGSFLHSFLNEHLVSWLEMQIRADFGTDIYAHWRQAEVEAGDLRSALDCAKGENLIIGGELAALQESTSKTISRLEADIERLGHSVCTWTKRSAENEDRILRIADLTQRAWFNAEKVDPAAVRDIIRSQAD